MKKTFYTWDEDALVLIQFGVRSSECGVRSATSMFPREQ